MDASHIKRLAPSKSAPINSVRDNSVKVPRNNKARTGVLPSCKQHGKNASNHRVYQRYFIIFKNTGMPERNYKLHSSKNFFVEVS